MKINKTIVSIAIILLFVIITFFLFFRNGSNLMREQIGVINNELDNFDVKIYEGRVSQSPEKQEGYTFGETETKHLEMLYTGNEPSVKISLEVIKDGAENPILSPRQLAVIKDVPRMITLPTNLEQGNYNIEIVKVEDDQSATNIVNIVFEIK